MAHKFTIRSRMSSMRTRQPLRANASTAVFMCPKWSVSSPASTRLYLPFSLRHLTSNFCFSLWWLWVSGLRLRAWLLSSRRRKLSKCCTPWSRRGETSFLNCGRETEKNTRGCSQWKYFNIKDKVIIAFLYFLFKQIALWPMDNWFVQLFCLLFPNNPSPLVIKSASTLSLSVGECLLGASRWKNSLQLTHAVLSLHWSSQILFDNRRNNWTTCPPAALSPQWTQPKLWSPGK